MSLFHKKPRLTAAQQNLVDTWAEGYVAVIADVKDIWRQCYDKENGIDIEHLELESYFCSAREVGHYAARELEAAFSLKDRDLAEAVRAAAKKMASPLSPRDMAKDFLKIQTLRRDLSQEQLNTFKEKEISAPGVHVRALPPDYVAAFRQVVSQAQILQLGESLTSGKLGTLEAARRPGDVQEPAQTSELTLGK